MCRNILWLNRTKQTDAQKAVGAGSHAEYGDLRGVDFLQTQFKIIGALLRESDGQARNAESFGAIGKPFTPVCVIKRQKEVITNR